jgi:hypothetical protein
VRLIRSLYSDKPQEEPKQSAKERRLKKSGEDSRRPNWLPIEHGTMISLDPCRPAMRG